jgi:hypothetical protein
MSTEPQKRTPADPAEVSKSVHSQIKVGLSLMIVTIAAVLAMNHPVAVGIAVAINVILIAFVSMHLKDEKKTITQFLVFTAIFIVVLFGLTALAHFDSTGLHH